MNLLFITRKIDSTHPLAGFAEAWVGEFGEQLKARHARLWVITLEKSINKGLPDNIELQSVRQGVKNSLRDFFSFLRLLQRLVPHGDAVFVHQHPVYALCAVPFTKWYGKKLYLWYVHKHVDIKLRLAAALCHGVFTASGESFRLKTKTPVYVVGHGIDTASFRPLETPRDREKFMVVSIGRISPVKGYDTLIDAAQLIVQHHHAVGIRVVGGPGLASHAAYFEHLKQIVRDRGLEDVIIFTGPVPHTEVVKEYQAADLFVNLSDTSSLDKAVLEAMACGVPVITSNEAFKKLLFPIDEHLCIRKEPQSLAHACERVIAMPYDTRRALGVKLRNVVVRDHDLKQLVARILSLI